MSRNSIKTPSFHIISVVNINVSIPSSELGRNICMWSDTDWRWNFPISCRVSKWWNHLPKNSKIQSKKTHFRPTKNHQKDTGLIILPAQTIHYCKGNPSKSPYICIKLDPPEKWVAFNDPWDIKHPTIPPSQRDSQTQLLRCQMPTTPVLHLPPTRRSKDVRHLFSKDTLMRSWGMILFEVKSRSDWTLIWNPGKFLEDTMKFCSLDVLQN